jgi:glutamate dehydrogenase
MVKNVVIVAVGAKGGFVLKRAPSPSDRDAYMKEGIACYQDYLRALLDLTDNRVGDRIVPPPGPTTRPRRSLPGRRCRQGTATFSDYANAISREYGFWLAGAFASGGSVGYDHKAMGITARGAWESVTALPRDGHRHPDDGLRGRGYRRHVGRRVRQRMLPRGIRLLAAFDHRHIFLVPIPTRRDPP